MDLAALWAYRGQWSRENMKIMLPGGFAGIVLGALTGTVIIKTMFTPEHLASVLTNQLQQIFQRPVQVQSVAVVVFRGIKIKGLRVLDAQDIPGRDFISGGEVSARYGFLSLLQGRLVITDLVLDSPRIQLIKRQDGSWNFSDITYNYRMRRKQQMAGLGLTMGLKNALIYEGKIIYINLKSGVEHTLYGVNLNLSDFTLDGDFPLSLSFLSRNKAPGGKIIEGSLRVEGNLNLAGLIWNNTYLKDIKIYSTTAGKYWSASGDVRNFLNPEINGIFNLPGIEVKDWNIPESRWSVKAAFPVAGRLQLQSAEGRIEEISLRARGVFDFFESSPAYKVRLEAGPVQLLNIVRWRQGKDDMSMGGTARVKISIDGGASGMQITKFFATLEKGRGIFNGFIVSNLGLVLSASDNFRDFSLKILNAAVYKQDQRFSAVNAEAKFTVDTLSIENFSAKWNGLPVKLKVKAEKLMSKARRLELYAFFDRIDITAAKALAYTLSSGIKVSGASASAAKTEYTGPRQLKWLRDFKYSLPNEIPVSKGWVAVNRITHADFESSNLKVAWSLKGMSSGMGKLGGSVAVEAGPGVFYQVENLSEKAKFYRVAFLPFMAMYKMDRLGVMKIGARFKDMSFNKIAGDYDFSSGRMMIRNFYVDGSTISACSTGVVNWIDENMRVKVYTTFNSASMMGGLSQSLTDSSGKPALAFALNGYMASPSVNMLNAKKNGTIIAEAVKRGIRADFSKLNKLKGEK